MLFSLSSSAAYNALQTYKDTFHGFFKNSDFLPLIFIDCRPLSEFQKSHIANAIHTSETHKIRNEQCICVFYAEDTECIKDHIPDEPSGIYWTLDDKYTEFIRKYPFVPQKSLLPNEILHNELYISNHNVANTCTTALQCLNITHIINCSETPISPKENILVTNVPFADSANAFLPIQVILESFDTHRRSGAVLVNCREGQSRSCAAVCCVLMKKWKNRSFTECLIRVQSQRMKCSPNKGFFRQLEAFAVENGNVGLNMSLPSRRTLKKTLFIARSVNITGQVIVWSFICKVPFLRQCYVFLTFMSEYFEYLQRKENLLLNLRILRFLVCFERFHLFCKEFKFDWEEFILKIQKETENSRINEETERILENSKKRMRRIDERRNQLHS